MDTIISVRNLTRKFKDFTAVDAITFDVARREIFGFLGPNGAGKSTTIRMLTTLLRPTAGSATVAGYDIVHQQTAVRRRIGLVAEKIILYNHLTALENLEFFGRLNHLPTAVIHERADRWIKRLGMEQWRSAPVGTFSTGMKQRINIARALLTEPDILFLDEPTLGLDPQTSFMIRSFIEELNGQGTTAILTTHDMMEAEGLCDRVAIIDHGRIAALDTVASLKRTVTGKDHPTLEDVFLNVTGFDVRDVAGKTIPSGAGPHGPRRGGPKRVR